MDFTAVKELIGHRQSRRPQRYAPLAGAQAKRCGAAHLAAQPHGTTTGASGSVGRGAPAGGRRKSLISGRKRTGDVELGNLVVLPSGAESAVLPMCYLVASESADCLASNCSYSGQGRS